MHDAATLPHSAVLMRGRIEATAGPIRPLPLRPALQIWQRHHGETRPPAGHGSVDSTFDRTLASLESALAARAGTELALVYLAQGHSVHYRSPVLPHLLERLPRFASIIAMRAEEPELPQSAWRLAFAATRAGQTCLILQDRLARLTTCPSAEAGALDYVLLGAADDTRGPALARQTFKEAL